MILEKHTKTEYQMFNVDHYYKVWKTLKESNKLKFSGEGQKTRTYECIPKHKSFNFLRKAFEECGWTNIKKFRFKSNPEKECYVDQLYWDYVGGGYIICALIHSKLDNNPNKCSHTIIVVKNVNPIEYYTVVVKIKDIEIIE